MAKKRIEEPELAPIPEKRILRLNAHGGIRVSEVRETLSVVEHAYNCLLIFDATISSNPTSVHNWNWIPEPHFSVDKSGAMVLPTDQLVVSSVQLSSPGLWEFLGNLNPLEVMRKYLQDRHERRKDVDYRDALEAQRLALENQRLWNEIVEKRIQILKQAGAPDSTVAMLVNQLILRPLDGLGALQDRRVITIEPSELSHATRQNSAA